MDSSSQHKGKDDEKHGGRPQGMDQADTGKKEHEHEHGKEMSEHHSSHHDQGSNHGHGHREEHVGGREAADPVEYLDMGGMGGMAGAFLQIRYRKATGRPYDKMEGLISSEKMATQQQREEEEAEAGREENKGVIYEF